MKIQKIDTGKILSETNIGLADYVINPYKGCGFGCIYCYAQKNKNIKNSELKWGEFIFVKRNCIELLKKELEFKKPKRILIGSTTDPFQNCEKDFKLTFQILKILKEENIPVVILTRSPLIEDYIEILKYSPSNIIFFTFNSFKVHLLFENNFCEYSKRIETIEKLFKEGINLITYISPFFPFLTDYKEIFKILKGKTKKISFEGYNIKMGSWEKVKEKLDEKLVLKYNEIFFNEKNYYEFWQNVKNEIEDLNKNYNFDIKFFIPDFNEYY